MNKSYLHKLSLSILFGLSAISVFADVYYKEVKRNFQVNKNVRLDLEINFADLNIQTWDQSTMDIIVKMDVSARDQNRADEMFGSFTVNIIEGKEMVDLTVGAGNWSCNGSGKNSESYKVTVEIHMPADAIVDGKCSFGDVRIGDMRGACELNTEYGDMKINGLWSYENDVRVAFGNADINGTNGGDFRNEYGSLELGLLQGNAEIHSSFGDLEINRVAKECKDLEVKVEYADAEIHIASDAGFRFEANSSYGDIDLPGSAKKNVEKEDYSSKEVTGTIGSAEGKLEVECDFGDIDIDIISN